MLSVLFCYQSIPVGVIFSRLVANGDRSTNIHIVRSDMRTVGVLEWLFDSA